METKDSRDGSGGDPSRAESVPAMYADVAVVSRNAFTVHLQLGASVPGGNTRPLALISMSESFARSLCQHVIAVLDAVPADSAEHEDVPAAAGASDGGRSARPE